jgi:hypothetical protein
MCGHGVHIVQRVEFMVRRRDIDIVHVERNAKCHIADLISPERSVEDRTLTITLADRDKKPDEGSLVTFIRQENTHECVV